MKFLTTMLSGLLFLALLFFPGRQTLMAQGTVCVAPDNSGTALLPADCPYTAPSGVMYIIDGLPAGDTIKIIPTYSGFSSIVRTSGGSLGGEVEEFDGSLEYIMTGTGTLSGFTRNVTISTSNVVHTAPRTSGNPIQSFDTDMRTLQGQLPPGDPDFDLLRVTAGTAFGMPSPGHTTLTRKLEGNWNVDSFFDITYRIDFVGAPGGVLTGRSGSTTATIRLQQGTPATSGLCVESDNGSGSVDLPADCPYIAPSDDMHIIDGLPPGSTVDLEPLLSSFLSVVRTPGGSLSGEVETYQGTLMCDATGTGAYSGYSRSFSLAVSCETHVGPRTSGNPVQSFDTDMFRIQGQLPPGDPDFDLLRITAGTDFGLPSPGHTTLTQQPGGNWNVDSFFDITYRIDFVGAPGGPFAGRSGSTTGTIRMQQGVPVLPPIGHEVLVGTDNFPPKIPYLSKPDSQVIFSGTSIRLKNLDHSQGSPVGPPPPLSSYQDYNYDAQMRMLISMDNGVSFQPVAATPTAAIVRMTHTQDVGDVRYFDTEMLSLDLSGLPGGMMLRESPTRASTGRTTIRTVPGGYMVNSFFDVFTEISFDGVNWSPSSSSITMETAVPLSKPELLFASGDLTGDGRAELLQFHLSEPVAFSGGQGVKKIHMYSLPPLEGPGLDVSSTVVVTGNLSLDFSLNGIDFNHHTATPTMRWRVSHDCDDGDTRFFETEMLQLDISGGTLPPGTMIRESPTLRSTGRTTIRVDASGGGYQISSFFDVFFEVSIDGGENWSPATTSMHLQFDAPPLESPEITFATDMQPPRGVWLSKPGDVTAYPNGVSVKDCDMQMTSTQVSPPSLGNNQNWSFGGDGSLRVSVNGVDFERRTVTVTAQVDMRHVYDSEGKLYFETEMIQMELRTITVSAGIILRESPTLRSSGRTTISGGGGGGGGSGGFMISSFFDVFFEVSTNDGSTWVSATEPTRIQLDVPAPVSPEMTFGWDLLPPRGRFRTTTEGGVIEFSDGSTISDFSLSRLLSQQSPPELGDQHEQEADGVADFKLRVGGDLIVISGATLTSSMRIRHDFDFEDTRHFDTEMLQLDISGPAGVTATADIRLRESPSRPSLGRMSACCLGSSGEDGVDMRGFFDIFPELSLDGGATWVTATASIRLQLDDRPVDAPVVDVEGDSLPPKGLFLSKPENVVTFPDGSQLKNIGLYVSSSGMPPDLNGVSIGDIDRDGRLDLRIGSGNFEPVAVTYTAQISFDHTMDSDPTQFFETEMLQMTLTSIEVATPTATIMLRESPSRPSLGQTSIKTNAGGGYSISSFFDIFTELSTDGGTTWLPGDNPLRVEYTSSTPQLGSLCITKYFDVKHDQVYDGGDPPMSGVVFHLSGNGTVYTGTTDEFGQVCFEDIITGDYVITEELPNGYSYSVPESGELAVTIAAGSNTPIIWLNGAADDTLYYRTASMEDWATAVDGKGKAKAIKCKPDKVEFKFLLTAPKAATGVSVKIGQVSSGVITDASKTVTLATWTDAKEVTYTAPIESLQVLQFEGWGTKGKAIKASFKWMTSPKITKGKVTSYLTNNPRLPMPNLHNVGEDLDKQGAFPLAIGAASGGSSVSHAKYKDVLKSLTKKGTMHTGNPRCLDATTEGKPLDKQVKSLPPDKQDNKLFAEVLTLGLNLRASENQKFPLGLGSLIWNGGGYAETWTIDSIYKFANLWLACDTNAAKVDTDGVQLYNMLVAIDTAFRGELDTIVWSCTKLELTGVRKSGSVIYLRSLPGKIPHRTGPKPVPYSSQTPVEYVLHQNYPNPFNPTTMIQFELPEPSEVTMKVYNMLGQEVVTLLDRELMEDGIQEVEFDANGLPSGVYFYRLTVQTYDDDEEALTGNTLNRVMKMLLIK